MGRVDVMWTKRVLREKKRPWHGPHLVNTVLLGQNGDLASAPTSSVSPLCRGWKRGGASRLPAAALSPVSQTPRCFPHLAVPRASLRWLAALVLGDGLTSSQTSLLTPPPLFLWHLQGSGFVHLVAIFSSGSKSISATSRALPKLEKALGLGSETKTHLL